MRKSLYNPNQFDKNRKKCFQEKVDAAIGYAFGAAIAFFFVILPFLVWVGIIVAILKVTWFVLFQWK